MSNITPLPRRQRRLSVNINKQSDEFLSEYMRRSGVGITEAVRRFIGVAGIVLDVIDAGGEVLVRRNGEVERVVFNL